MTMQVHINQEIYHTAEQKFDGRPTLFSKQIFTKYGQKMTK